jgi:hypothetical protein
MEKEKPKPGPMKAKLLAEKIGRNQYYANAFYKEMIKTEQWKNFTNTYMVRKPNDIKSTFVFFLLNNHSDMTKEDINEELLQVFKRHPGSVVDWLVRTDSVRNQFFEHLVSGNKQVVEKFQHDIIEKLQLTRAQVFQTLKPIMKRLSELISKQTKKKKKKMKKNRQFAENCDFEIPGWDFFFFLRS